MFLASWSISSWLLVEIYYFAPFTRPAIEKVQQAITIPRHDQWDLGRFPLEVKQLLAKLESSPAAKNFPFYHFDSFLENSSFIQTVDSSSPIVWDDFRS